MNIVTCNFSKNSQNATLFIWREKIREKITIFFFCFEKLVKSQLYRFDEKNSRGFHCAKNSSKRLSIWREKKIIMKFRLSKKLVKTQLYQFDGKIPKTIPIILVKTQLFQEYFDFVSIKSTLLVYFSITHLYCVFSTFFYFFIQKNITRSFSRTHFYSVPFSHRNLMFSNFQSQNSSIDGFHLIICQDVID